MTGDITVRARMVNHLRAGRSREPWWTYRTSGWVRILGGTRWGGRGGGENGGLMVYHRPEVHAIFWHGGGTVSQACNEFGLSIAILLSQWMEVFLRVNGKRRSVGVERTNSIRKSWCSRASGR